MDPEILREYVRNIRNRYAELELSGNRTMSSMRPCVFLRITLTDAQHGLMAMMLVKAAH